MQASQTIQGITHSLSKSVVSEAAYYACQDGTTISSHRPEDEEKWGETWRENKAPETESES